MIPSGSAKGIIAIALLAVVPLQHAASAPSLPNHPQGYVISREVDLVVLPVTVRNREGQFITGLKASNFRVYENGESQTIADFWSEDTPVSLGLVVDHSGSMAGKSQQVIEGAMAFIDASNPQDEEFVINFADKVTLGLPANLAFTSNGNELKAALSTASASGRTALYDAVIAALQHLDLRQASKKALILISDGGDNLSQHTLAEVLRMAQSANVAIYTIGLLNEESADQNPKVLRQFAKETGGVAYFPGSSADIARVCRQIAADIRHQYTLAYSPAGERHNAYRKIRVDVIAPKEGKLLVRTRAGYFRPSTMAANSTGTRKVGR